ncbi:MAG TPA: MetQ/NlpA family ABC transporter substrate-binding protein [Caulobacteraceae bacterium]|nr:MetQ/NlpA family ABC transporter substrate-binding protein [Caulobacteraceae bacterium]
MILPRLLMTAVVAAAAVVAACTPDRKSAAADDKLVVAATAVPHAEILEHIRPALKAQGVDLEIRVFNDYVQPNMVVDQGQADANYFQTGPYLEDFNRNRGTKLKIVTGVHVEPFGAYSRRWKAIAEVPQGATVAIPNDPSTTGRALQLLHTTGLITLKDPTNALSTLKDIAANPKGVTFRELEAPALPRVLDQVDLALINTNYALDAKLNPSKDALAIESKDSPYVNFLVAREDRANDPDILKLAAALRTPEVKAFIEQKYQGAVVPAF